MRYKAAQKKFHRLEVLEKAGIILLTFFCVVFSVTHLLSEGHHPMISMAPRGVEDTALALIAEGQDLLQRDQQQAGEEKFLAALDKIVRQYQSEMIGFCVDMLQGTGVNGEEVAQEVFVAAYQTIQRFEARASLRTWLYQIARNMCAHVLRDETRHRVSLEQNRETILHRAHRAADIPTEQRLQHQELLERVQSSLTQLREADRTILVLTYMRELTTAQIAEILMITPQEVRTRRSRALQRLRMVVEHDDR
jgi:RNA polymerase sigma-70 factor (ECF subfamily)